MITFTRNSLVLVEGNSINDKNLPFQAYNGLRDAVDAHYMDPDGNGSFRRPIFVNRAVDGSQVSHVAGRIVAEWAEAPYTHLLLFLDINDAHSGVPLQTSRNNADTIMAVSPATTLWAGGCCWGEDIVNGNAFDAAIAALDEPTLGLAQRVTSVGGTYVSTRTGIYVVQEARLNPLGTGVPLTRPDASVAHLNPAACSFFTRLVMAQVTLS